MARAQPQPRKKRVIVIGGGMAGLAAARELQHRRYHVVIVEARARVGGRLQAIPIGSQNKVKVDIGGALIHGIHNNPLTKICQQIGIPTTGSLSDCLLLDENGWPIDPKVDERVSKEFNEVLDKTFQTITQHQQEQQLGESCEQLPQLPPIDNSFGTLLNTIRDKVPIVPSPLWTWHQNNLELSGGAPLDQLGYNWNDDEPYGFEGDHVALITSWQGVTDALAEGMDILYHCPIQAIRIVEHQETVVTSPHQPFNGNGTYTTTPLSTPTLSDPVTTSEHRSSSRRTQQPFKFTISSHSALSYDNTALQYPSTSKQRRPPPPPPPKVLVEMSHGRVLQADAVVCTLPLGVLKSNTVRFDPPLSPAKQHAIASLGCGLLNKCILSFSTVFWQESDFIGLTGDCPYLILNGHVITSQPILIFMFGGTSAFQVEQKTDHQIITECLQVLKNICHMTPPEPLDHVVTRWGQDPYSRMSFSYVPTGVQGTHALTVLSEPILSHEKLPLVLFAGEHTTPFHPSTIHGAFLSGIREAYRLDLAWEPKLNDSLTFQFDFMYQKTFPLRRGETKATGDVRHIHQNHTHGSRRRQRRHGVMTLRKKRNMEVASSAVLGSARKSKRARMDHHHILTAAAQTAQEDRTLERAIHAYSNWNAIAQKVLPLYGSTKPNAVLQQRYQSIRKSLPSKPNVTLLQEWLAEDQYLVKEDKVDLRHRRRSARNRRATL